MQVVREGDALYVGHFGISGMGTSILDVSDPAAPRLVDQWPAPPGTHTHKVQAAGGLLLVNEERFRDGTGHAAGMRVYDLADPETPREVAHWLPAPPAGQAAPQTNDLFVDAAGLVWVTDRLGGGLAVLEPEPELAALMAAARA
jgi:streptogramin lyase